MASATTKAGAADAAAAAAAHTASVAEANAAVAAVAQRCDADLRRPQYHCLPRGHWLNDPNGLFRHPLTGYWHCFAQHNAHAAYWGEISWTHFVSSDLVHWRRLPIILVPSADADDDDADDDDAAAAAAQAMHDSGGVWSGCCVVKRVHAPGRINAYYEPTLYYTGVFPERQCVAVPVDPSDEYLIKWRKKPLAAASAPPLEFDSAETGLTTLTGFRDPFVFTHYDAARGRDRMFMVVGSGHANVGCLLLYENMVPLARATTTTQRDCNVVETDRSDDRWVYQGVFYSCKSKDVVHKKNPKETMWECPNVWRFADTVRVAGVEHPLYVVCVSPYSAPLYNIGYFDVERLRFVPLLGRSDEGGDLHDIGVWRRVDLSRSGPPADGLFGFYAPQSMRSENDDSQTMLGWIDLHASEGFPWRGAMSLARKVTLVDVRELAGNGVGGGGGDFGQRRNRALDRDEVCEFRICQQPMPDMYSLREFALVGLAPRRVSAADAWHYRIDVAAARAGKPAVSPSAEQCIEFDFGYEAVAPRDAAASSVGFIIAIVLRDAAGVQLHRLLMDGKTGLIVCSLERGFPDFAGAMTVPQCTRSNRWFVDNSLSEAFLLDGLATVVSAGLCLPTGMTEDAITIYDVMDGHTMTAAARGEKVSRSDALKTHTVSPHGMLGEHAERRVVHTVEQMPRLAFIDVDIVVTGDGGSGSGSGGDGDGDGDDGDDAAAVLLTHFNVYQLRSCFVDDDSANGGGGDAAGAGRVVQLRGKL